MVIENDPSARVQLRASSELQPPACCYICGSGNCDKGYVDFGTFVDYHGAFYLCVTCVEQVVSVVGFFSPEEVAGQQELLGHLKTKIDDLESALNDATERADAANRLLASRFASSGSSESVTPVPEQRPEPTTDPQPFGRSEGGESESEKSTKGSERRRVSGLVAHDVT